MAIVSFFLVKAKTVFVLEDHSLKKINLSRVKYSYFGCLQEQALTYALSPAFKRGHYITAFELLQCNVLSVVSNRNKKN